MAAKWLTRAKDETHDEFFHRLIEARRVNTVASDEYIEQPHMLKPIAQKQDALNKDTVLPKPSPKTRALDPSEDGEEADF